MINPEAIDPHHAKAKVEALDAQIKELRERVKTLTAKREIFAAAAKRAKTDD